MFKDLGKLMALLSNPQKIKEQIDQLQQKLAQITAEGQAGAGMVRVRVNGKMEVLACILNDEVLQLGDREMLEDLIRAATNQALERVRQQAAEETAKMTTGLGLPPGMGVPGLPGSM